MGHSCLPHEVPESTVISAQIETDSLLAARLAAEDEMYFQEVSELESDKSNRQKYEKSIRRLDHAASWQ